MRHKDFVMNANRLTACTFAMFGLLLLPTGEAAAKGCGHAWAKPGTYTISGNFRCKVEAAGAHLTRDCRVSIRVPGVSSYTLVRKAGKCLRFGFKVDGVKKAFTAKWCNKIGFIPWNGKKIRTKVKLVKRAGHADGGSRAKQNFN